MELQATNFKLPRYSALKVVKRISRADKLIAPDWVNVYCGFRELKMTGMCNLTSWIRR